jgi:hypothetical protein
MSTELGRAVDVVATAERASSLWRLAVLGQQEAAAGQAEFYAVAGELVATLRALEALTSVLARQVAGYGRGRILRDDEGLAPGVRLADAVVLLGYSGKSLAQAQAAANEFWSAIGHIAVEDRAR